MKKLLSICLSIFMLLSICPLIPVAHAAAPHVEFDVETYANGKATVGARFTDEKKNTPTAYQRESPSEVPSEEQKTPEPYVEPTPAHTHVSGGWVEENRTEPTCTADGGYDIVYYCAECGEEISRRHTILPASHSNSRYGTEQNRLEATCVSDGSYDIIWHCSKCDEVVQLEHCVIPKESAEHSWDNGTVTKTSTETTEGEILYTCTVCGETRTEIMPKLAVEETGKCGDNITYTLWNDGRMVLEGSGEMTKSCPYEIRNKIRTLEIGDGITAIPDYAFYYSENLQKIILPASVVSIGNDAFYDCRALSEIQNGTGLTQVAYDAFEDTAWYNAQPDGPVYVGKVLYKYKGEISGQTTVSVKSGTVAIADRAFYNCLGLTEVTLPAGLTVIGANAFFSCLKLTKVTLPAGLTTIGANAFANCANLKTINDVETVTLIGEDAFANTLWLNEQPQGTVYFGKVLYCYKGVMPAGTELTVKPGTTSISGKALKNRKGMTKVTLPDTVTSIVYAAFAGCTGLTEVTLPKSVAKLDNYVFADCTALESCTCTDGLTTIGNKTFMNCTALKSFVIPNTVVSIGNFAFCNCTALPGIVIPDSVKTLGEHVFSDCTSLKTATIGSGVTSIGYCVFSGCPSLESLEVSKDNAVYYSADNCVIEKASGMIVLGSKNSKIPADEKVTTIATNAFKGCKGLTKINIPKNITVFGGYTFSGCEDLTEVILPDTITRIVYNTFEYCSSLPAITLPESLESIGYDSFGDCTSLKAITIPKNVTNIGTGAFSGCSALESITVADGNTVYYAKDNCLIKKESGAVILGCANSKIPADGTVKGIAYDAFQGQTALTFMEIPDGLEFIDSDAFAGCKNLTGIIVPPSVTSIGWGAIPAHTAVCGFPGTYAQEWANENGNVFIPIKEAYLTMQAPAVVNTPAAPLSGYATPDAQVVVTVNGKEAARIATESGRWTADIPLTGAKDGDSFQIDAALTFNGKTVSQTTTVVYHPNAIVFRSLTLNHSYYNAIITAEELGFAVPNITLVPGKPMAFTVSVTNSGRIDKLFVVSVKADGNKQLELNYHQEEDLWWCAEGFFDDANHSYVPGDLRIIGKDKDGKEFDTGVVIKFKFLIDPSGFVYEVVKSNVLEGVTATVYFKDADGNESPWNAETAGQLNPITTLADGAFAWDVPEGQWQVRVSKNGYQNAASEWMDVPPEWKNVYIPMVTTNAPTVSAVNLFADHADIVFDQYMDIDSINADTVVFEGYEGTFAPVDKTETDSGVYYAKCFRFTPTKNFTGGVSVKCIATSEYDSATHKNIYTGPKNYAGETMDRWNAYSAILFVGAEPKNLTADKTAEVAYGKTAEIVISAENAAGKTVAVTADNALVTLSEKALKLDEEGKATLTVTGLMPGATKLSFTLNGTNLTADTSVTVVMSEEPDVILGDVDGNGKVESSDARLALRASVHLSNEPTDIKEGTAGYKAADYDQNGKVESSDARCILRVSVKLDPFG